MSADEPDRVGEQEDRGLRDLVGVVFSASSHVDDPRSAIREALRPILQGKREAEARAATAEAELQRAVEVLVHHGCACDWNEASNDPRTHAPEQPCTYHAAVEAQLASANAEIERLTVEQVNWKKLGEVAEAAYARVEALEKAIFYAPHGIGCDYGDKWQGDRCNCWKADLRSASTANTPIRGLERFDDAAIQNLARETEPNR